MRLRILIILLPAALACGAATAQTPRAGTAALPIRINEVNYEASWVEIYNGNDQPINVSSFWLFTTPAYEQLGGLRVRSGRILMAPGTFLVVEWDPNRNADGDPHAPDGEVGLFVSRPFDDAGNLLSYVAFGAGQGDGLDSVATAAGRWQAGAAAATGPAGTTLSFFGGGATPTADWAAGRPTPGELNAQVRTAVEDPGEAVAAFQLTAAYPNPFRAGTRFRLTLAQPQRVRVTVYDVTGRALAQLVDATVGAGVHEVVFDATGLPSGVYLVRLEAGGQVVVRSLTLLK